MRHIIVVLSCILVFTISCKDGNTSEKPNVDTVKMKEIMDVHDEVMPKMSKLGSLVATLKSKEDSTAIGQEYGVARKDLQDAHDAMMDWMKGFGDRFDSDEIMNGKALTDQKKLWLVEEEDKVNAMREKVNTSIKNAELLLEKAGQE